MKHILLSFTFIVLTLASAIAQQVSPQISGKVVDESNKAIDFASVSLLRLPDSSVADGAYSENGGKFQFSNISDGKYLLQISFLGYITHLEGPFNISGNQNPINFSTLVLRKDVQLLDQVVVKTTKPAVEYELDKTVFNIGKDIQSMSTNATQVLEQIPMVQLDQEGVPSVMGQGVSVLIDGKPSRIYGNNIETVLKLIPSHVIEKIEVITSPSARYSTEDGAIVLNIVTKSKYLIGISGMAALSLTTNNNYSPSISVNVARKKFNINNSLNFEYDRDPFNSFLYRQNLTSDSVVYTNQLHSGTDKDMDFSYNGNVSYDITSNSRIGAFFGLSHDTETGGELFNTSYLNGSEEMLREYKRIVDATENNWNYRAGLDFKRTFENEDQVLNMEAYYSTRNDKDEELYNQISEWESLDYLQQQFSTSDDEGFTAKIDYVHPFSKKTRLESGFRADWETDGNKFRVEEFNETSGEYQIIDSLSNDFVANEAEFSLYSQFRTEFNNFSIQAGLRLEDSKLKTEQKLLNRLYDTHFLNLIPTIDVAYKLQNNDRLKASYSRRARTPRWRELNPFVDYSNPENIRVGNPNLSPEFINAYEFSYNKFIKQFNVYASVFYRNSNNTIQRINSINDKGVFLTTFDNIGQERYFGLETGMGADILPQWKVNMNIGLRKSEVFGFEEENSTVSFTGRLSTFFPMPFGFKGYVFARYRGPQSIAQGRRKGMLMTSVGARKSFMNERANVSLRLSDLFNQRQWASTREYASFIETSSYQRQSRFLTLSLSYLFGKLENGDRSGNRDSGENGGMNEGGMEEGGEF